MGLSLRIREPWYEHRNPSAVVAVGNNADAAMDYRQHAPARMDAGPRQPSPLVYVDFLHEELGFSADEHWPVLRYVPQPS